MFVELSLNIGVKRRNLATSNVLHSAHEDLYSDKTMFFSFWSVSRLGAKIIEIKVAEINVNKNEHEFLKFAWI